MTEYLTVVEVLAIHADQLARYGGSDGVRDLGLIEAALYRPQTGYYSDLIQEASALWESLSQNHPFVDGNKRVGFAVAYTFLYVNGVEVVGDPLDAYEHTMRLHVSGEFDFERLDAWLRAHTRPL